jgi:hypothetical protein
MDWRTGKDFLWTYSRYSLDFPRGTDITARTSVGVFGALPRFELCTSRIRDRSVTSSRTAYLWSLYPDSSFLTLSFPLLFKNNSSVDTASINKDKVHFYTWHYDMGLQSPVRAIFPSVPVVSLYAAAIATDNACDLRDLTSEPPPSSLTHIQCLAGLLLQGGRFVCTWNFVHFTFKKVSLGVCMSVGR